MSMINNDDLAQKELYAKVEKQAHSLRGNPLEYMAITGMCPVNVIEMHAQKIQALLAERDADKKRIAELEDKQRETLRQARSFREAHESAAELIRRYDSKTIKLTPPTTRLWAGSVDCYDAKEILIAFRNACAAAGINLEVGE